MVLHILIVVAPIFLILVTCGLSISKSITFIIIYGCLHGLQDLIIWRFGPPILKIKETYWEDKKFYDLIALDQFLHLSVLFILWRIFNGN